MPKLRNLRYTLIISVLKVRMTVRGYHKMRRWTGRSITQKSHDSTIKATESLALLRPGKNYWLVPVSPCEFRRAIKEVSSKGSFTLSRGKGKKGKDIFFRVVLTNDSCFVRSIFTCTLSHLWEFKCLFVQSVLRAKSPPPLHLSSLH